MTGIEGSRAIIVELKALLSFLADPHITESQHEVHLYNAVALVTSNSSLCTELSCSLGMELANYCSTAEEYKTALHILVEALCLPSNSEDGRTGLASAVCQVLINDASSDTPHALLLVSQASHTLSKFPMLKQTLIESFLLIARLPIQADNHGKYIPALILARSLYGLDVYSSEEGVTPEEHLPHTFRQDFVDLFGRRFFALGGGAKSAYPFEVQFAKCLIEYLTQAEMDGPMRRPLVFKMVQNLDGMCITLGALLDVMVECDSSNLMKRNLNQGYNLLSAAMRQVKSGKESKGNLAAELFRGIVMAFEEEREAVLRSVLDEGKGDDVNVRKNVYRVLAILGKSLNLSNAAAAQPLAKIVVNQICILLYREEKVNDENASILAKIALDAWVNISGEPKPDLSHVKHEVHASFASIPEPQTYLDSKQSKVKDITVKNQSDGMPIYTGPELISTETFHSSKQDLGKEELPASCIPDQLDLTESHGSRQVSDKPNPSQYEAQALLSTVYNVQNHSISKMDEMKDVSGMTADNDPESTHSSHVIPGAYNVPVDGHARRRAKVPRVGLDFSPEITENISQEIGEKSQCTNMRGQNVLIRPSAAFRLQEEDAKSKSRRRRLVYCVGIVVLVAAVAVTITNLVLYRKRQSEPVNAVAPTSRYVSIRETLLKVSDPSLLKTPGTPQYDALTWIVHDDEFRIKRDDSNLIQRYILAVLYLELNNRDIFSKSNWLQGIHECEWEFVECKYDNITSLDLSRKSLRGVFPIELGYLEFLEQLNLSDNDISGQISVQFEALIHLKELQLDRNKISGIIPSTIGTLSNLEIMSMNSNQINGTIPNEIGLLSKLYYFDTSDNFMTGSLPRELFSLSNLVSLILDKNSFDGTILADSHSLSSIEYFSIPDNKFIGTIPSEIGVVSSLRHLNLNGNSISGTIPSEIRQLSLLGHLNLNGNSISGTIPAEIGQLSLLDFLDFGANKLDGTIPSTIGMLKNLESIVLNFNNIAGFISEEMIIGCTSLNVINLGTNMLHGKISPSIGLLSNLDLLNLGSNYYTGKIPADIGNLTNIRELYLFNNFLTGSVPSEIGNLKKLESLYIGLNKLTGSISDEICKLTEINLRDFDAWQENDLECSCCTVLH